MPMPFIFLFFLFEHVAWYPLWQFFQNRTGTAASKDRRHGDLTEIFVVV